MFEGLGPRIDAEDVALPRPMINQVEFHPRLVQSELLVPWIQGYGEAYRLA